HVLVLSLQSYAYIALFAGFYWMSWVQVRRTESRFVFVWALLATLLVAALVEVAQGVTGRGGCRVRDLVPDAAGALGAALLLAIWSRVRRKPAYVRLVKPRSAIAPPQPVPAPRAVVPPRGVVAPPPDFYPSPHPSAGTPPEVVAPEPSASTAVTQRLQPVVHRLWAMLQRGWTIIRARRRTIVVGVALLVLVGAAAFVVLQRPAPAPVVTAQPAAAPPAQPRPLQSDAEGYYEPGYQFTVADRRFTRLTLRPEPFLTFSRVGTRQEVGCADARIGRDAVYLRCEFDRVGMVTIDGRFTSRVVTSSLDTPVLSAVITVINTRGETLYRARDSFLWHTPD
ncbi:MAG: hypothetical protein ABR537_04425, partial [Gemmatimonadales bacterium]